MTMHLNELKQKSIIKLSKLAEQFEVENISGLKKHEIIYSILKKTIQNDELIYAKDTLEIMSDGYGFLRSTENNYLPGAHDIYVSRNQIKRFGLKTGNIISGQICPPVKNNSHFGLLKVEAINGLTPVEYNRTHLFENLTPVFPYEKFKLEYKSSCLSTRIIDMFIPIGFGQRCLIVAPPKAGKTVLLQNIANAITVNHKDVKLIILLIDERPEEVTDMKRNVKAEVISSTFDESANNHVKVAEMVIEKAKRLTETGKDVVLLLDSITRLARAYNSIIPSSGKILSGGVDANALHIPKRFLGAARKIEGGGSLTIISTALVDTGSRMDEVIFEEFKGTGNSEVVLDRKLLEKRIFPCLDINRSSTRKEDLLVDHNELQKIHILRKITHPMSSIDSMEFILKKIKKTKDNFDFFLEMNR